MPNQNTAPNPEGRKPESYSKLLLQKMGIIAVAGVALWGASAIDSYTAQEEASKIVHAESEWKVPESSLGLSNPSVRLEDGGMSADQIQADAAVVALASSGNQQYADEHLQRIHDPNLLHAAQDQLAAIHAAHPELSARAQPPSEDEQEVPNDIPVDPDKALLPLPPLDDAPTGAATELPSTPSPSETPLDPNQVLLPVPPLDHQ